LELNEVRTWYRTGGFSWRARLPIRAVDNISFSLRRGEILALVGESGSGKTTLGRTILGIQRETSGEIRFNDRVVSGLAPQSARAVRRRIQYVHQDPGAALDPWWSIHRTLAEGMAAHGVTSKAEQAARIDSILDAVGLPRDCQNRYPHELSGGQLRRVGIARILVLSPEIVILDEPTSGLDLSVQAMVLRLLLDIRSRLDLTYILISHDLSMVERICDRVAIMYLGKIVELGDARDVFHNPQHPYTRVLIDAAPQLDVASLGSGLAGDPPSPRAVPAGCAFHPRCPEAVSACARELPLLHKTSASHSVACLLRRG
jgi:oligopeptide/dipeptide ABC transporter ATP-binding protein